MKIVTKFKLALILVMVSSQWTFAQENNILGSYEWRNIGPANQGGRIVDIEAVPGDFRKVFVATATGGLWKSENAGTTWTPIFDDYRVSSIGDIALFRGNPDVIWVGSGEANNRNSVSWGNGVYKSIDGGTTFQHMGLETTHHIGRILIHPTDPNVVYVAAVGHLWGYSGERGLFRTLDGGTTWEKLSSGLPEDDHLGCTDLLIDPKDSKTLYAAFYHRLRKPWIFESGGDTGGIFKSKDGGKSWSKQTKGLPTGPTGRIGLAISEKNPKTLVALIEAERSDNLKTPGSGLYRSVNGGRSWKYINTYNNRPFYYSQVRINPSNDQLIYVLTTRFMVSEDGGKTLRNGSEDQEIHGDFHAMWIDPNHADRYYIGADKGVSLTFDHGAHFLLLDNLPIAQFYRIGFDYRDPYTVYGGLQDNGMYGVASFTRDARGILNDSNWKLHWGDGQFIQVNPSNYRDIYTSSENGRVSKYDPVTHQMQSITPSPANILNYDSVIPESERGKRETLRFNWTAPMLMSSHDPQTIFLGGNHLFKSTDGGDYWKIVSPDLSTGDPEKIKMGNSGGITPDNSGAETHCSISTLAPSTIDEAVIWAGTDDGNVHLTRDGGQNWTNVRNSIPAVPEGLWVSRIEAGHFDPAVAYITFDGHRSDNFNPWIFRTDDFGKNWRDLSNNLPEDEVIRVVREDLQNPELLFLGTEFGIWISLTGGETWHRFMNNMPTVPVLDLAIHPRDRDLIAGTHGRGIFIMDDISGLEELTTDIFDKKAHLFVQRQGTMWENVSRGGQRGHFWYAGQNPETIINTSSLPRANFINHSRITYYLGANIVDPVVLRISDQSGNTMTDTLSNSAGIYRYIWNMQFDAVPLSNDEIASIESVLGDLKDRFSQSLFRNMYDSFRSAVNPFQQRRIVERLLNIGIPLPLDKSWGLQTAGIGHYRIDLVVDGNVMSQSLTIRDDPLGKN